LGGSLAGMGRRRDQDAPSALADQGRGQLTTALLILSTLLLPLGLLLPALRTTQFAFWSGEHSILSLGWALYRDGELLLAAVALGFSVAFPVIKLVWMWRLQFHRGPIAVRRLRLLELLGKWSMADVMVLALIVFSVRGSLVLAATTLPGIYVFAAATILAMLASGRIVEQLGEASRPPRHADPAT
jgi:paraquat-inducible protein A